MSAFTDGNSGYTSYSVEKEARYAYYEPIGINRWVLMMIVPKTVIEQQERQAFYFTVNMTIRLSSILLLVFFYTIYVQKQIRVKMMLSDKCFRALAEQAGKVIFEWDFEKNKLITSTKFTKKFGREVKTKNGAEDALSTRAVHPEDAGVYRQMFETIFRGENIEDVHYRVKHQDGTYHWCSLSAVVIRNHKGDPYRAIGSLEDIHEDVCRQNDLKMKSENDQLTSVYNKITTEFLIKDHLDSVSNERCALLIIDIDNFKQVNDNLGHPYGDTVLIRLAEMLRDLFRTSDIIGRIGGDEFFVFMKNYGSEDILIEKANEICQLFRTLNSEETMSCPISASIGISLFPDHSTGFEELYQCADIALYVTKNRGKNGFTIYNSSMESPESIRNRTAIESTHQ